VSSIPGANTLFEGRQTQRKKRSQIGETPNREKRDQRRRSRKIQAADPKRNQDRSETQRQRVITHCKIEIVVTTSEVVNKEV
jgi:hypothetical protein